MAVSFALSVNLGEEGILTQHCGQGVYHGCLIDGLSGLYILLMLVRSGRRSEGESQVKVTRE